MNRARIMIVEDDPVMRDLTGRQLKLLGYEPVAVPTGEEAIQCLPDQIVMIFMDIGLPGIDGGHATLIIREKELRAQHKRVPIIALTAHSDKGKCALAGMDDFLQKPALLNDIKQMVEKWLPEKIDTSG